MLKMYDTHQQYYFWNTGIELYLDTEGNWTLVIFISLFVTSFD